MWCGPSLSLPCIVYLLSTPSIADEPAVVYKHFYNFLLLKPPQSVLECPGAIVSKFSGLAARPELVPSRTGRS